MPGTVGGRTGPEPRPPGRGTGNGPTQEREIARTIDAYSASRDARSGERHVMRLPSWRALIRRNRD